jgi:hypothetical protein
MLHYYGDITAMDLSQQAKHMIWMYCKPGETTCKVPYIDLALNKRRYVLFEKIAGVSEWVFLDLTD